MAKRRQSKFESSISFENSRGIGAQGTLMQLSRNAVVFEVYNPYSVAQLSEVLKNLRIRRGDRDIYSGRGVVTNLMSTGLMLVVSASLVDPWSDLAGLPPGPQLRAEVEEFLADWTDRTGSLQPSYIECVSKISNFLEELSRWLEHGETIAGIRDEDQPAEYVEEWFGEIYEAARMKLLDLFGKFEDQAAQVPRSSVYAHKAYVRRELHPLMLCSPFVHRTFTKPLGYAGDYQMVNMLLSGRPQGGSTYAKLIDKFSLQTETSVAHRNRIERLTQLLNAEARRVAALDRRIRVLDVGCGPAAEVVRFVSDSWVSDRADLELMDFNEETLDFTAKTLAAEIQRHRRHTKVKYVLRSIDELLKEVAGRGHSVPPTYDMIYCAGLFDYLGDAICGRLLQLYYDWLLPGGLLVVTNVHPGHRILGFMEHLLEWNLELRNVDQMRSLAPTLGAQTAYTEATGFNVLLEIRKPMEISPP